MISPRKPLSRRASPPQPAPLVLALLLVAAGVRAAQPAADNAVNYNGTSQPTYGNGANAGSGFQPFNLFSGTDSGNFLADFNPDGSAISSAGGKVFDIYAQYGGFAGISRPFTATGGAGAGALSVGDAVSFRMDLANTVDSGGNVGFTLESGNSQSVNFQVSGGNGANVFTSSTDGALTGIDLNTLAGGVAFTLTVNSARQFTVTAQGVTNPSVAGSFTFTTGSDLNLTALTIYDYTAGSGNDLYFNNLAVTAVPEPATCFAGIGCAAALIRKSARRRRGL